jgi:hypothetical protein
MVWKASHKRVRFTNCPCCGERFTRIQGTRLPCDECIEFKRDAQ